MLEEQGTAGEEATSSTEDFGQSDDLAPLSARGPAATSETSNNTSLSFVTMRNAVLVDEQIDVHPSKKLPNISGK